MGFVSDSFWFHFLESFFWRTLPAHLCVVGFVALLSLSFRKNSGISSQPFWGISDAPNYIARHTRHRHIIILTAYAFTLTLMEGDTQGGSAYDQELCLRLSRMFDIVKIAGFDYFWEKAFIILPKHNEANIQFLAQLNKEMLICLNQLGQGWRKSHISSLIVIL